MANSIQDHLTVILDELDAALRFLDEGQCRRFVDLLAESPAVFLAGAGRSGLMARAAAMRLMHLGKTAHVVGDTTTPAIRAGDLLVVASGSGSTSGMVAAGKKAVGLGAGLAVVTADASSPLAAMADAAVILPVRTPGPDAAMPPTLPGVVRSSQPMANLFEQSLLLFFDAAVMELMRRDDLDSRGMFSRHANLE